MDSQLLDRLLASPLLPEILQEGQRQLGREKRMREKFYRDITPEHKWEFIQGQVIMHSPALNRHIMATQNLASLMLTWVRVKNCGAVQVEKALCVFPRNDYEPDIVFFGLAKSALPGPDTLHFPVPDLVVEVLSPSTEERDRGIKFLDYAAHGVSEYCIIDSVAETVEIHRLPEGADAYPPAEKQSAGHLFSEIVPGFSIPVTAIFREVDNLAALKAILEASA
jgi:Uma2 family endonuclease